MSPQQYFEPPLTSKQDACQSSPLNSMKPPCSMVSPHPLQIGASWPLEHVRLLCPPSPHNPHAMKRRVRRLCAPTNLTCRLRGRRPPPGWAYDKPDEMSPPLQQSRPSSRRLARPKRTSRATSTTTATGPRSSTSSATSTRSSRNASTRRPGPSTSPTASSTPTRSTSTATAQSSSSPRTERAEGRPITGAPLTGRGRSRRCPATPSPPARTGPGSPSTDAASGERWPDPRPPAGAPTSRTPPAASAR